MNEIKVGSEWVNSSGAKVKILSIGEEKVFVNYQGLGETIVDNLFLKTFYKPAPVRRTVWLNVYEDDVTRHSTKNGADWMATDALLWQQEVDLIDPRDGEKG